MGVGATLVVSLMVGGRLWGLIACHHYVPRFIHFEIRAICELLAETIGTRIAALESFIQAQSELTVRRIEQRLIEAISRDGDWRSALFDGSQSLLQPLSAAGAALHYDGQVFSAGEVPGTQEIRAIAAWLDKKPRAPVISTASLGLDEPEFAPIIGVASGLVAVPLSSSQKRLSNVVSSGAGSYCDLGWRSLQTGHYRQRPVRAIAPPFVCTVAPNGRRDIGSLDSGGLDGGTSDRRIRSPTSPCSSGRSEC